MKTLILIYLITSFNSNKIDSCREKYLDFVLQNGFSHRSYYLNLGVKDSSDKTFDIVVMSVDLYDILKKEKGIGESEYVAMVKSSITNNKPIKLAKSIQQYQYIVKIDNPDEWVDRHATKGERAFVDYFFGERDRSTNQKPREVNLFYVAKTLFNWCIPVKAGDDEGLLYPDKVPTLCSCSK
jgi:hypothetical protein